MAYYLKKLQKATSCDHMVVQIDADASYSEKLAITQSAQIAGVELTLLTAQAASALAYSYLKRYEFDQKTQRIVCIVDMGHSGITITFGLFLQKLMDVYLTRTNRNLGGRNMDKILM